MARQIEKEIVITARNESGAATREAQSAISALSKSVSALSSTSQDAAKNSALLKAALADPGNAGKSVNEIVRALGNLDGNAKKAVGTVADLNKGVAALSDTTGTAAKQADELGEKFGKVAAMSIEDKVRATRNWGLALAGAGAGGIILSNKFAEAGRDFEETQNLIAVSFGEQTKAVQDWSQGLQESLGLNATEVERSAATFNLMFKSMGFAGGQALEMSKTLTMLAGDMESLYNLDDGQAFDKLKAGITGEAEPLKALGILINEETIKQYAYANGIAKVGDELTQQQKVMARYGAILEQTATAQGDMKRSYDTATAASRRAGVQTQIAMRQIGIGSAEAQKSIDEFAGSLVKAANVSPEIAEGAGAMQTYGSYAATAGGGVLIFASGLFEGARALQELGGLSGVWRDIRLGIGATILSVRTLTAAWITTTQAAIAAQAAMLRAGLAAAAARGIGVGLTGLAAAATAIPVLIGTGTGLAGAEIIRRRQVASGDKLAPGSFGEMLGNTWARISGGEVTQEDGLTASQRREKMAAKSAQAAAKTETDKATKALNDSLAASTSALASTGAAPISSASALTEAAASSPQMVRDYKTGQMRPAMDLSVELSPEAATARVDELERSIRDEGDKARKKIMQDELRALKRDIKDRKEYQAKLKKQRLDALKGVGIEASAAAAERTAQLLESSAQLRGGAEIEGFQDKRQLNRDIRNVRSDVKDGRTDKEAGDNRIQSLRDAYAAREAARAADLEEQIAQIDAQTALAEGAARAAGQQGALAKSTLRIAQARADRVVNVAAAKAQSLREEARSLATDAEDALRNTNNERAEKSSAATRELAASLTAGRLRGSYDRSGGNSGPFGMRGGDYGNGPSFVGNNAAAMASGISRASMSFANRGTRGDGYENRDTAQPQLRATVMSVLRDALGDQVANVQVTFKSDDGMMSAARLLSN
jgi:hypothetical protein